MIDESIETFKRRLRQLIDENSMSMSAFARFCELDRSTLSQILSPHNYRLPRLENTLLIASKMNVSIDWLIGLSNNRPGVDDLPLQITKNENENPGFDDHLDVWFEESLGQKVRYSPSTLPELLKTKAVNTYEFKDFEKLDHKERIARTKKRLGYQKKGETDLEVCNSFQAVEGFIKGEGVWKNLSKRNRLEQVDYIIEISRELYPSFRWYLYDIKNNYSVPLYIYGRKRACVFTGESYFVFTQTDHIKTLISSFDNLIRNAVFGPTQIEKFLFKLRKDNLF